MNEKLFEAILDADDIDRFEYDDVYLMDSLVGTEMYITNATPTKEYLQESNKSSRERVAENAGRRIASAKVKHSVWGFNIDWCRIASKAIADAIGADAYDLFLDDDDYNTIILKYVGKVPLTPEQKMKAREILIKLVGEKDLELSQSKSLNESYDSDTRTSVKVEFRGRDSDEVEDIVEDVNELHNTTFFAHELGNKIYVESSTLFTSVAKLEDILEEFLSRGANEIRFIKA